MSQFRAAKKLDALDARIDALEAELRTREVQAVGAELTDAERRQRYFSIDDIDQRRKLIGVARALNEVRRKQHAAAVAYWSAVAAETRTKLADLKSESPSSYWRRGIWLDILTIIWILVGAGWLLFEIPGAIGGAVLAAVWTRFLVPSREKARLAAIRKGEDVLRSSENELRQAQHEAAGASSTQAVFSPAEEDTGMPA